VAAGNTHSRAITAEGSVVCWGQTLGSPTPAGQFVDLAAGFQHTCGLRSNGSAACWVRHGHPGGFVAISAGDVERGVSAFAGKRVVDGFGDGRSTRPKEGGSGWGLALCRKIIESTRLTLPHV
jgi:hypothetical protein